MNINKFTQKSMQAVQDCEKIAYDYGHQQIDQEHFLYSLFNDSEGLIPVSYTHLDVYKRQYLYLGSKEIKR